MKPPLSRPAIAKLTERLPNLADPVDAEGWLALLRLLYAVGRHDLALGRLFEGHVDALQIIARYGSEAQRTAAAAAARAGGAFGVWNADQPGEPVRLNNGTISGAKAFASGAGILTRALVTAETPDGRQLVIADLQHCRPEIDRSWWRVTGMQRSETHIVRWHEQALPVDALLGRPGDYTLEPWFSGGALRFAAVQAGGAAAVVDQVRDHLRTQRRDDDPHQCARLAKLYLAAQAAADRIEAAARCWRVEDPETTIAHVAAARCAVYTAGETVLTLAPAAVGVQSMFVDHPLAATLADLSVYLRQPGPDAQRMRAGEAVASGRLAPNL